MRIHNLDVQDITQQLADHYPHLSFSDRTAIATRLILDIRQAILDGDKVGTIKQLPDGTIEVRSIEVEPK